ncbi:MAG: SpoIIE family protein phosphatase [Thermoanaerobaculia bacterium]|nr:SpoIIE family protein phosphatase [Thermoanaerobaculia bacterium]
MVRIHVVPADGQAFDYPFEGDSVVVGRSSSSDLVLADKFLSRQHARLYRENGTIMVEDLGSRNGTLLNGSPVQEPTPVEIGDVIKVSGSVISLHDDEHPSKDKSSGVDFGHTVFRDASDLMQSASSIGTTSLKGEAELRKFADRLRLLNEVHQALNESLGLDELLEMILDRVFVHLQPEQGMIFIKDADGEIRPAAQRSVPGLESEFLYSRTLIKEVIEKGLAALVLDVASDDRFGNQQSIVASGVRSLVAAPLLGPDGSLGMIALNSRLHVRQFSEDDMELLTSLASIAAMRIRNVALQEEALERRRLEEELALARRIQVGLLPDDLPDPEGWEIHAGNVPSRGVSGDYYQISQREEKNELVVMLADVSGKGMGASLLTASLEALAAGPIEEGFPPAEVFGRVSRRLFQRTPPEKYATGFLVCLQPDSGVFAYSNAGHNYGLLVRAGGEVEELGPTGTPIGLVPNVEYKQEERTLEPGDALYLYTDGFVEAENPDGEEYSMERMEKVFVTERGRPLEEIARSLEDDVREFARGVPFHDDRTLVILRRGSGG